MLEDFLMKKVNVIIPFLVSTINFRVAQQNSLLILLEKVKKRLDMVFVQYFEKNHSLTRGYFL